VAPFISPGIAIIPVAGWIGRATEATLSVAQGVNFHNCDAGGVIRSPHNRRVVGAVAGQRRHGLRYRTCSVKSETDPNLTMKHTVRILLVLLLPFGALRAEITMGVRVDIGFNKPLNLQGYNGPNVEVAVQSYQMGTVSFVIIDHENAVAVARTNINSVEVDRLGVATVSGTNRVELKPPTVGHSIGINSDGFAVKNSDRQAYLLYSHPSGISVYWFDVLDTKQNECALLIVPAARPASETALLSIAEKIKAIDQLEAAGVLGAAEARRKRTTVMDGH
jgi:hypothetical protein